MLHKTGQKTGFSYVCTQMPNPFTPPIRKICIRFNKETSLSALIETAISHTVGWSIPEKNVAHSTIRISILYISHIFSQHLKNELSTSYSFACLLL